MKKLHRSFFLFLYLPTTGLLLLGYLPFEHYFLDILSQFKVQFGFFLLFCFAVGMGMGRKRIVFPSLILLIPILWEAAPFYLSSSQQSTVPKSRSFSLLTMNVLSSNNQYEKALAEVERLAPDIVVLVEPNRSWWKAMAPIAPLYAYQSREIREDNFGIALLSKIPLDTAYIRSFGNPSKPSIVVFFQWEGQPIGLLATHPPPPGSERKMRDRNVQLQTIAQFVRQQNVPFIVTGDLNTTSFSHTFKDFLSQSGLQDSRMGFGLQPTWPVNHTLTLPNSFPFMITLDHTLTSPSLSTRERKTGSEIGSDHLPVFTALAWSTPKNNQP